MFCPVRCMRPHALVDLVIAKPWTIVDLGSGTDIPHAPYALPALSTPREMVKDAGDKNIALLYESHCVAVGVVRGLLEADFSYNIALVNRSEWLEYWVAVDAGVPELGA